MGSPAERGIKRAEGLQGARGDHARRDLIGAAPAVLVAPEAERPASRLAIAG